MKKYFAVLSVTMLCLSSALASEGTKLSSDKKYLNNVIVGTSFSSEAEYKQVKKAIKKAKYTGIVVDVRGLKLETTIAPRIYDTDGRVVYGEDNIDLDLAISQGMVEYTKDFGGVVEGLSRAGANPMIVKAVDVRAADNSVNMVHVVISPEDADKILLVAKNNSKIFLRGSVVFVR